MHFTHPARFLPILAFCCVITQMVPARAQLAVLSALEKQIADLRHDQSSEKKKYMDDFFTRITSAAQNPDQAIQLYDEATAANGGPPLKPGKHKHKDRPQDEQTFGTMVQAHCGLLRFAALYITSPDSPNLTADWKSWLASAASNYPLLGNDDLKNKAVQDSVIAKYFNIDLTNKDQSGWSISQLPDLYLKYILKPLGEAHDPRVLPAWDTYGAMLQFDQQDDPQRWANITLPSLSFKKAVADYRVSPSAVKLQKLYALAKQYPAHPDFDKWVDEITGMINDMKAKYAAPAPSGASPVVNPAINPAINPPITTH